MIDERIDRGLEPSGGSEDDNIGFMAKGKLRKKKEWHKGRFYQDMTDFYSKSDRKRIWTKPSVELRPGMSRIGSLDLEYRDESLSPTRSPGKSPTRGGRLGRKDL